MALDELLLDELLDDELLDDERLDMDEEALLDELLDIELLDMELLDDALDTDDVDDTELLELDTGGLFDDAVTVGDELSPPPPQAANADAPVRTTTCKTNRLRANNIRRYSSTKLAWSVLMGNGQQTVDCVLLGTRANFGTSWSKLRQR